MPVGLARPLAVELLESGERPGAVDGGGPSVHQEGDADRLGGFPRAGAMLNRGVGVRGDAPVAFLADGDGQGDELLGLGIERARCQRGVMKLLVSGVHLRDRVPQLARGHSQLVTDGLAVAHLQLLPVAAITTWEYVTSQALSPWP